MKITTLTLIALFFASCSSIHEQKRERIEELASSPEVRELESLLIREKQIENKKEIAVTPLNSNDLESIIKENKSGIEEERIISKRVVAKAPAVEPDAPIKPKSERRKPASIPPQIIEKKSLLTVKRYLHVNLEPTTKGFLKSAKKATAETLRHMLAKGMDINVQGESGKTALIVAVEFKRYDIVRFLLKNGANKKIADINGLGPYEYATKNQDDTMKRILLATE